MDTKKENQLIEWAGEKWMVEVVWKLWMGKWPTENEREMVGEMMTTVIDHGPDSPSAQATIAAAKDGRDVIRSVELGVGELNEKHGGAIGGLGRILKHDKRGVGEIVAEYLDGGKRLPGFGHRLYKDTDPRTVYLFQRAAELGFWGNYVERVVEMETELTRQKGKKLPVNVDGAMAAILLEMEVEPELMNAFFLWPRVAGLIYQWKTNKNNK